MARGSAFGFQPSACRPVLCYAMLQCCCSYLAVDACAPPEDATYSLEEGGIRALGWSKDVLSLCSPTLVR